MEYWPILIRRPDWVVDSATRLISLKCSSIQRPNSRASNASSRTNTGARCIESSTTVAFTPPHSDSNRMPRL